MTTLNARANQAWNEIEPVKNDWDPTPFYSQQEAFEEGWETGYKAARAEVAKQISEEILMYNQEWSANTWRSIAARIAREAGGES